MSSHAQVDREEGGAHPMAEGEVVCTSLKADKGQGPCAPCIGGKGVPQIRTSVIYILAHKTRASSLKALLHMAASPKASHKRKAEVRITCRVQMLPVAARGFSSLLSGFLALVIQRVHRHHR